MDLHPYHTERHDKYPKNYDICPIYLTDIKNDIP
jgi:hypothetical protein